MRKMQSMAFLYGALAQMATMTTSSAYRKPSGSNDGSYGHGIPDKPKRVIPNGCNLYKFYGIEVIATSEKRAEQKAYKIYNRKNK